MYLVTSKTDINAKPLVGPPGSGKSHLLEAIGRALLDKGISVRYDYAVDLLDRLKACFDTESNLSFNEVWESYGRVGVLLLDDLGVEQSTRWTTERLSALIDARYRNERGLVIATNLTSKRAFEGGMGERTASRLWDVSTGLSQVVTLTASDYRMGLPV